MPPESLSRRPFIYGLMFIYMLGASGWPVISSVEPHPACPRLRDVNEQAVMRQSDAAPMIMVSWSGAGTGWRQENVSDKMREPASDSIRTR